MVFLSWRLACTATAFRTKFGANYSKDIRRWFPRHMYIGLQKMQAKMRHVDCVIEVHDARVALSGRNMEFHRSLYGTKPHILILSKVDLIDRSRLPILAEILKNKFNTKHVLYANLKSGFNNKVFTKLVDVLVQEAENQPRYNRTFVSHYGAMVIGIPNVGKSTLINGIRRVCTGKVNPATRVGPTPGVTRTVLEKIRISDQPPIYIFDTPGVVAPSIESLDVGLRLALCQTVLDHTVGLELMADFVLFWCNLNRNFKYVDILGLKNPSDQIIPVLTETAQNSDFTARSSVPGAESVLRWDLDKSAIKFINAFRRGKLGEQFLDGDLMDKYQ